MSGGGGSLDDLLDPVEVLLRLRDEVVFPTFCTTSTGFWERVLFLGVLVWDGGAFSFWL